MARPKKDAHIELSEAQELTAGLIERMTCPAGKSQTFMRDTKAPGLRVRATPASAKNPQGVKAFVFEAKLNRQNIRRTIGDVRAWTIDAARSEANRLRVTLDAGTDPREVEREKQAGKAAKEAAAAIQGTTVSEAWSVYLAERRPFWREVTYKDHVQMAHAGGDERKRMKGVKTIAGPLAHFMTMRLADLSNAKVHEWAACVKVVVASAALGCLR